MVVAGDQLVIPAPGAPLACTHAHPSIQCVLRPEHPAGRQLAQRQRAPGGSCGSIDSDKGTVPFKDAGPAEIHFPPSPVFSSAHFPPKDYSSSFKT